MKRRNLLIVFCFLLPAFGVFLSFSPLTDSDQPVLQNIIKKFEAYFTKLPQQKVYLHFDKSSYNASETVWFKAYLVNASNHKPDGSTSNLYIDLINPSGYIVQNKLIRMTNGFGNGDFSFKDTIPEGVYKIRAFTNWMQNISDDFFFEKEIYIANPEFKTYVSRDDLHLIKKEARKSRKYGEHFDVRFLPEGGHLLSGVENCLGYKAINKLGHGTSVSGIIQDSKGKQVAEFKSSPLGIGSVRFTPVVKEKYTAIVNINGNKPLKIDLPESIDRGVNITARKISDGILRISLLSNFSPGQFPPNTLYYVLVHVRGKVLYSHEFDLLNPGNFIDLSTSGFPSGIIHITLFNVYSQPVSERLCFVNNHDEMRINLATEKRTASIREKMSLKISTSDKNSLPLKGFLSLSIVNSEDSRAGDNIFSNLLLNSDLKGKVEEPQYYFSDWNESKENQLDDLMLTQGWRRFSWNEILSGTGFSPRYENEKGITITGRITKEFFNIPLGDIKVTLSILNEFNDVFTTRSDYRGYYRFENLDYRDTVSVSIEAVRANGRHSLVVYVNGKPDDKLKDMRYETHQNLQRQGEKGGYKEPPDPDADDPYAKENNRIYRLHEEPSRSNVIIIDEKTQSYQNVSEILEARIPGITVSGNKVNIRGVSSLYGNTDPLFLVDGMPVDPEYALNINLFDVQRIEVLKGAETAIYGSKGANGVIAIYTKRGKFMKKGVIDFKMLGYVTPKEYYNPGFEYRSDDPYQDDRRTILWKPNIITDSSGEMVVTFYTSDVKGKYLVEIEGISENGIPGVGYSEIEVK